MQNLNELLTSLGSRAGSCFGGAGAIHLSSDEQVFLGGISLVSGIILDAVVRFFIKRRE